MHKSWPGLEITSFCTPVVAAFGESAVHKFDAQGMRRQDRWIAYVVGSATNQAATPYSGTSLVTTLPVAYW